MKGPYKPRDFYHALEIMSRVRGFGDRRRKAIRDLFPTLELLMAAKPEDFRQVHGMSRIAEACYKTLHDENGDVHHAT